MAKKVARKVNRKASKADLTAGMRSELSRGKGLGVFLPTGEETPEEKQELVQSLANTVAEIPVAQIEVNPYQPRKEFDPAQLDELSESIKVHGLIQPITVRQLAEGQFQLISGERRLRASKLAGKESVPAYIRIADDQGMLEMALIENLVRADLNPVEVATTYQRLIDEFAYTHERFGERVSKGRSTVSNYLSILKLAPNILEALKAKEISMGHAKVLYAIKDSALQLAVFKEIQDKELSVRQAEELARSFRETRVKTVPKTSLPDEYVPVQQSLRNFFGSKRVQLKVKRDGKGQIVIPFNSTEELNTLLDSIEE